jgi:hypothetical protein
VAVAAEQVVIDRSRRADAFVNAIVISDELLFVMCIPVALGKLATPQEAGLTEPGPPVEVPSTTEFSIVSFAPAITAAPMQ